MSAATIQQRRRGTRACTFCAERKIRCSGSSTCSACAIRGLPCEYLATGKKRGPVRGAKWQKGETPHVGDLVNVYRTFVHPHWPMIDCATTECVQQLSHGKPLLFKAMMTIAQATQASSEKQKSVLHMDCSGDEKTLSTQVNSLPPSLTSVQTLLLLSLIELGKGAHVESFRWCSQACVVALQLGLHRTVDSAKSENALITFWSVYSLDKLLAIMLDKPMLIRRKDCTTPLETVNEERCSRAVASFLRQARLMTILEQIIETTYTASAKGERFAHGDRIGSAYVRNVDNVSQSLKAWQQSLPSTMQWHCGTGSDRNVDVSPQIITMTAWFHACSLLLHKPAFRVAQQGDTSLFAQQSYRKVCDSATAIAHCLDWYAQVFSARRIPTSWVFLTFLSAVIHASCVGHPEQQRSGESERVFQRCIQHLREIAKTWKHAGQQVNTLQAILQLFTSTNDEQIHKRGTVAPTALRPDPESRSDTWRSEVEPEQVESSELDIRSLWNQIIASFDSPT